MKFLCELGCVLNRIPVGWLPECRGATDQQFIQGGSGEHLQTHRNDSISDHSTVDGDPIVSEFFVKYVIPCTT